MDKKFERRSFPGFLTIITVFVIICLVTLGALALSATSRGAVPAEKNAEYMKLYRDADNLARLRLAEADGCIAAAAYSGLFDLNFEALISELDYIQWERSADFYVLSCTTPADERTAIYWEIKVNAFPDDRRGGYELVEMKLIDTADTEQAEDEHLNVWLG